MTKKERRRFGENHAPRDVENRAEELIVVGDRVDQTADLDQTFVDVKGFAKRFYFRQHAYFSHSRELTASRIFCVENSTVVRDGLRDAEDSNVCIWLVFDGCRGPG